MFYILWAGNIHIYIISMLHIYNFCSDVHCITYFLHYNITIQHMLCKKCYMHCVQRTYTFIPYLCYISILQFNTCYVTNVLCILCTENLHIYTISMLHIYNFFCDIHCITYSIIHYIITIWHILCSNMFISMLSTHFM